MNRQLKKIKKYIEIFLTFYKKNLGQVVFLSLLLWIFILIRQLPYFNVIPQYHFYVIGIYVVLIVVLFRKQISSLTLFRIIELLLLVAMFFELFQSTDIASFIAFIIFNLITVVTLIELFIRRKELKEYTKIK